MGKKCFYTTPPMFSSMKKSTICIIGFLVFLGVFLAGCAQPVNNALNETPETPPQNNQNLEKEKTFVDIEPKETLLKSPAENYALALDDLEAGYLNSEEFTRYVEAADAFTTEEAREKAIERGWLESYQIMFQKEASASVLLDALIVKHELILYDNIEGAEEAFAEWKNEIENNEVFSILSAPKKGEESIAYRFEIENEDGIFAYSTISFRTKNLIHTVLVGGVSGGNVTIDDTLPYADAIIGKLE